MLSSLSGLHISGLAGRTSGPSAHALELVSAVLAYVALRRQRFNVADIWSASNGTHGTFTSLYSISERSYLNEVAAGFKLIMSSPASEDRWPRPHLASIGISRPAEAIGVSDPPSS
jgi:hypothetical protein